MKSFISKEGKNGKRHENEKIKLLWVPGIHLLNRKGIAEYLTATKRQVVKGQRNK